MIQLEKNKQTINTFLEAGLHFGHQTNKWNPKNKKYIFGEKNGIHIIDVSQTVDYLNSALKFLNEASEKGDVLFVATKKQAQDVVKATARSLGMPYVISRWPGGLLTNFNSVKQRIHKMDNILKSFSEGIENRTKKELVLMKKELKKLERLYGGVRVLEKKPAVMFVIDSKYEKNAVREANKLGIPVVSILDTNADPAQITFPIPGNDDAIKSITLICKYIQEAVIARTGMPDEVDFVKIDEDIQKMTEKLASRVEVKVVSPEAQTVIRVKSMDMHNDIETEDKIEELIDLKEVEKEEKVKKPKKVVASKKSSAKTSARKVVRKS